ncbi:LysR family transcriptional regulator [Streptomyces malaysiensis]|uniref:LysR family transcriptional regulator n=1 Tax=Streptomyces malaysiensis TaxID=92644 RepID=UPI002B2C6229|nr:LysR family transcriptional regulator [Streptomyces malaysiensis]
MKSWPDLRLLATYLAVIDNGSMADAAQVLGYVPSAVSQHIAALERSMGVELLARKPGRRIAPTAAGRSLERAIRELFVATATYQDAAEQVAASEVAEVRIGTFPTAMTFLLPGVLRDLADTEPGINVHIVEMETPRGLPMLKNGDIDLLLAYRYLPEDPPGRDDGWTVRLLGREPLYVVSNGAPASRTLEECLHHNWVGGFPANADTRMVYRMTHPLGMAPHMPFETEDSHAAVALIEAGLAVGPLPAMTVQASIDEGRIFRVQLPPSVGQPSREILAITRANYRPAIVDRLVSRLQGALRAVSNHSDSQA